MSLRLKRPRAVSATRFCGVIVRVVLVAGLFGRRALNSSVRPITEQGKNVDLAFSLEFGGVKNGKLK